MILKEENLTQIMHELYAKSNDWIKVLEEIREKINSPEQPKYNSISSNYTSLFIFELINQQINTDIFKEVIKNFYYNCSHYNLECMFSRFFERSAEISLKEYLENRDKNTSIWVDMEYAFLDLEKDKLIFDRKNLPYLQICLEEISEDKIKGLYYGRFIHFCYKFRKNLKELIPIFKITQKNIAFEKKEAKEYTGFIDAMIKYIGDDSFENTTEYNREIYTFFKNNINNFDNRFFKLLFPKDDFSDKDICKANFGIIHFALTCDVEIISYINDQYTQLLKNFKKNIKGAIDWKIKYDFEENVIAPFRHSLPIALEKMNFLFDINKIDITKPYEDNFIYLKLLEIKISQNEIIKMSKEMLEYIKNIEKINFEDDKFLVRENLFNNDILFKYLSYLELEMNIPQNNEIKNHKPKI